MAILSAENVSFSYYKDSPLILDDITVSIKKGEAVCLLGPNGVGKSTLLNLLCGLLKPNKGRIYLENTDISHLSSKNIAQFIGYVPQKIHLSFNYSVLDYVLLGRTAHMNLLSLPSDEDKKHAMQALEDLDLLDYSHRSVNDLSGGEQQKVSIARALAQNPQIIVFDEPTSALDYGNQVKVLKLVQKLIQKDYAVIMTTHNPDHPLLLDCMTWLLRKNGKIESAPSKEIINRETLTELYGTDVVVIDVKQANRSACFMTLSKD